MNGKRVNIIFLVIILVHFGTVWTLQRFGFFAGMNIIINYLVSEGIVVIPAFLLVFLFKEPPGRLLGFHKMKMGSFLMVIVFTMLTSPAITLVNIISQLFVSNTTVQLSQGMIQSPFWVTFLFVAVFAPVCEETVCRGIIYQGYCRSGSKMAAILLSALIFGMIHLNFNQAAYAFVMGIFAALLVEATGSLWSSIFYHLLINGYSVCVMYLSNSFMPEPITSEAVSEMTGNGEAMMLMISVFLILAAVTLPLAAGVLVWMAGREGRQRELRAVWQERKYKKEPKVPKEHLVSGDKIITAPLIIALILCITYMVLNMAK